MRPRHPGQGRFPLRQAAQQGRVGGGGRQFPGQRRRVPRPADHRDRPALPVPGGVPQRGPQHLAHVGLAALLVCLLVLCLLARAGRGRRAHLGHRLGQRGERGLPIQPGLDQVIPPALRIVVPGRGGEHGHRVLLHLVRRRVAARPGVIARPGPILLPASAAPVSQQHRGRQVAEPDRHLVPGRPLQRLPLRREHRVRPERGYPRRVRGVGQQRHRRDHARADCQRQHRRRVGGPLDQHHDRPQPVQFGQHRAGRTRPVMPDAEHRRPARGGSGHPLTSRHAR